MQSGAILWLVGRPAAGKTTAARLLVERLRALGAAVLWLDGDELRAVLTPSPTYSDSERDFFYGALGALATIGARGGSVVVLSATAPRRRYRDAVRAKGALVAEIYLSCPEAVLTARDTKGLYRGAERGEVTRLPGAGAAFEPPLDAELAFDTSTSAPAVVVDGVIAWLSARRAGFQ